MKGLAVHRRGLLAVTGVEHTTAKLDHCCVVANQPLNPIHVV
jgi:hypothetical protein